MYKIIVTLVYGQFGQTLYAQRLQAAFGRPKDPGVASGRLKILYDYIFTKIYN